MKILCSSLIAIVKLVTKPTMFVAMLAWLLIPSLGYSTDGKVYPGASCQPLLGSTASDFLFDARGIRNLSTVPRQVTCPIIADNNSFTPGERVEIQVWVQSFNGQPLTCTAFSLTLLGTPLNTQSDDTDFAFPTTLHMILPVVLEGFVYNLTCGLPPQGVIFNQEIPRSLLRGYLVKGRV